MRTQSQEHGAGRPAWESLANWLALLALLALGIVWSPADAESSASAGAGSLGLKSAPDASPRPVVPQETRMHLLAYRRPRLTLISCHPFDSLDYGGPLRRVVTAALAGAQARPPGAR